MDNYSSPKNAEKWIYTFPKFPKKMDIICCPSFSDFMDNYIKPLMNQAFQKLLKSDTIHFLFFKKYGII